MCVSWAAVTNDGEEAIRKCSPHAISDLGFSEQAVASAWAAWGGEAAGAGPQVPVLPSTESFHTNPGWRRQEHETKMDFPRSQRSRHRAGPAKTFNQSVTVTWAPPPGKQALERAPNQSSRLSLTATKGLPGHSPSQQPAPSLPHCVSPLRGVSLHPHSHTFNPPTSHSAGG